MYQSFMWLCHIVFILNGKVVKTAQFTLKLLKRHVFGEYLLWQEAQIIETVLEFSLNLRSQQSPTLNWSIWSNTLRLVLHRLKDFQVYIYIYSEESVTETPHPDTSGQAFLHCSHEGFVQHPWISGGRI